MPLFLLYLSNIGDIMARSFKWLYAKCCLCRGCPGVSRKRAERKKHRQAQIFMEYDETSNSWQVRNCIILILQQYTLKQSNINNAFRCLNE